MAAVGVLFATTGCVSARSTPTVPRVIPPPPRIEVVGGLLGAEILPAPSLIVSPVIYDLPVEANSWVESELNFLVNDRRDILRSWLGRGDYYRDFVVSVLLDHGIPSDLYHLAMIESGYTPTARSSAGAVGMWQFMPATSRDVQLRIDDLVDERMDPVRSTRAAARHLRTLYRVHGDWALAAAAYNAGSTRISRSLERHDVTNFWDLARVGDLAEETRHYVPRLYAVTIVAREPERFGFDLPTDAPGFGFDSIHVEMSIPFAELAEMTEVPATELAQMNPHLRRGMTPSGGYWVWVPAGAGVRAQRSYLAAVQQGRVLGTYTVRWGDNLSTMAQITGVASSRIRELNPEIDFDRLQAGADIRLPEAAARQLASRASGDGEVSVSAGSSEETRVALSMVAALPANDGEPAVHQVRSGDTLSEIAEEYGVSVSALQAANSMTGTSIRSGQRLVIPATGSREGSDASSAVGETVLAHVVEAGETLWDIAIRYGSSVQEIQSANGLGGGHIRPGQKLDVPASRR